VRWMSFAWLRRWVPLLLPAVETAWLIPWVLLVSGAFYAGAVVVLAPPAVAGLLVGGFLLSGAVAAGAPLSRRRVAVVLVALVGGLWAVWFTHYRFAPLWHPRWIWDLLLAAQDVIPDIPAPVAGALAAPLVLWRGIVLGGQEFSHFAAEQAFRRGIGWSVLFTVLLAVFYESEVFALARPAAAGYVLGFFFLSLVLLTLARLLGIWEEVRGKDPRALTFNRPWFAVALAVVTGIVLVGAGLGRLAGLDLWPYAAPVLRLLSPVLEAIFLVLFFVASVIARILLYVIERLPWRGQRVLQLPEPFGDTLRSMRDLRLDPQVVAGARWGMVALVVLLLALIFLVVVIRGRRRAAPGEEDERESVWEGTGLQKRLRRLLARRPRPRPGPGLVETSEVVAIRRIYRRFLRAAAEAGMPRGRAQTAREFARAIAPLGADPDTALQDLTGIYEAVRYGAYRPHGDEVARAQDWLAQIRAAVRSRAGPRT